MTNSTNLEELQRLSEKINGTPGTVDGNNKTIKVGTVEATVAN